MNECACVWICILVFVYVFVRTRWKSVFVSAAAATASIHISTKSIEQFSKQYSNNRCKSFVIFPKLVYRFREFNLLIWTMDLDEEMSAFDNVNIWHSLVQEVVTRHCVRFCVCVIASKPIHRHYHCYRCLCCCSGFFPHFSHHGKALNELPSNYFGKSKTIFCSSIYFHLNLTRITPQCIGIASHRFKSIQPFIRTMKYFGRNSLYSSLKYACVCFGLNVLFFRSLNTSGVHSLTLFTFFFSRSSASFAFFINISAIFFNLSPIVLWIYSFLMRC